VPRYKYLAHYYDQVFDFAHSWGEIPRVELLKEILPRVGSACDLACGTGTTALEFARGGIRMCAVDLSPTMCELAS
jgi:ubiquinone/menaquinone biosynthesis C-methylase UbiE